MKLALYQKAFIYQHLALGTRKCVIIDKVNKEWGTEKSQFKKNHMAFYTNKWKAMSSDERMLHLPYSMEQSFATQEVRINDDIRQLQLLNQRIDIEENEDKPNNQTIVELQGMGVRLKNRIAQELGQARAFTKGGIGNINILQMQLNKFEGVVSKISNLSPEERIKLLETVGEIEEKGGEK